LPTRSPHLRVTERDDAWDLEYDAQTRYTLPRSAVVPLATDNATAERLAELLTGRIVDALRARGVGQNLARLTVGIEETPMQAAFYTLDFPAGESQQLPS
jgi:hypothetical protein